MGGFLYVPQTYTNSKMSGNVAFTEEVLAISFKKYVMFSRSKLFFTSNVQVTMQEVLSLSLLTSSVMHNLDKMRRTFMSDFLSQKLTAHFFSFCSNHYHHFHKIRIKMKF